MLRKRGWACIAIAVSFSVGSACGDDASDGTDPPTSADETTASGDTTEPTTGEDTVDPSESSDTAGATSTDADSASDDTSAETGPTRGAVSMHVVPKGDCSLGDTWVDFPEVEGGHPVTATAHDTLSENLTFDDQGRTVKVDCERIESEVRVTYLLGLSADSSADLQFFSAQVPVTSDPSSEGPTTFTKGVDLPQWRAPSEQRCQFSAMQLSKESIWGTFTCPLLTDGDGEECEVVEGHFYFENCIPRE